MDRASHPAPHEPVLPDRVAELLVTRRDGAYVDLTVGSAGHLNRLAEGLDRSARLFGVDRDPEAVARARRVLKGAAQRVEIAQGSYAELADFAAAWRTRAFDGILLDLGLSSEQLDSADRGFAFRLNGPLDMRFDTGSGGPTAAEMIGRLTEEQLVEIFRELGQERQAWRVAAAIVRERQKQVIAGTADLRAIIESVVGPRHVVKSLARVFQALRIAVNRELEQLRAVLPIAVNHLRPGGRLAVISYHSLEDRLVKHFFREQSTDCLCPPRTPVCVCGHKATLELVTRRAVVPSEDEALRNPRARSARLRVARRREP